MENQNPNTTHRHSLSKLDRLALWITQRVGTMGFFFVILGWTLLWLGWNLLAPASLRFDPFPAFVLWLFISNLIQINLMPLIMIGQNIQGRHAEIRADHDYDVDKHAFAEIAAIQQKLDANTKLLEKLQKQLEQRDK